jgi:hypothetical protein
LKVKWPDFQVYLGTVITKDGAMVKLAVTYHGETREKLMSCDQFAQMTGFDDARMLGGSRKTRIKRRK